MSRSWSGTDGKSMKISLSSSSISGEGGSLCRTGNGSGIGSGIVSGIVSGNGSVIGSGSGSGSGNGILGGDGG